MAKAKEKVGHGASKPYSVFRKSIPRIEGRRFPSSAGVRKFGPEVPKMAILHMGKILKNGQNLELPFDGRNGQVSVGGTNFANRLGGFEDLSETCFETLCRSEAEF